MAAILSGARVGLPRMELEEALDAIALGLTNDLRYGRRMEWSEIRALVDRAERLHNEGRRLW